MISTLLLSGFAACGTGALFALLLAKPLYGTLGDACGTGRSAAFWTAYSTVMMILAPALGVLLMAAFPSNGLPVEVIFSRALLFGLACLIIALLAIGNVMGRTAFKQFDADLKAGLVSTKPERQ